MDLIDIELKWEGHKQADSKTKHGKTQTQGKQGQQQWARPVEVRPQAGKVGQGANEAKLI